MCTAGVSGGMSEQGNNGDISNIVGSQTGWRCNCDAVMSGIREYRRHTCDLKLEVKREYPMATVGGSSSSAAIASHCSMVVGQTGGASCAAPSTLASPSSFERQSPQVASRSVTASGRASPGAPAAASCDPGPCKYEQRKPKVEDEQSPQHQSPHRLDGGTQVHGKEPHEVSRLRVSWIWFTVLI